MTAEHAIDLLNHVMGLLVDGEYIEAVGMARDALMEKGEKDAETLD